MDVGQTMDCFWMLKEDTRIPETAPRSISWWIYLNVPNSLSALSKVTLPVCPYVCWVNTLYLPMAISQSLPMLVSVQRGGEYLADTWASTCCSALPLPQLLLFGDHLCLRSLEL